MFTYDGIKRVNCILQGNKIIINGESYEITSTRNITGYKSGVFAAGILLIIVSIILGGFGLSELLGGGDKVGSLFLLSPFLIILPLSVVMMRMAIVQNRCRSIWRLNFYHTLCFEASDDINSENILSALPVPDETNLPKPSNKIITKIDKIVLVVLGIVTLLSLLFKTPYWAEILLLLPGYLAYLRIKDVICDLNNLKWQNDTRRRPTRE